MLHSPLVYLSPATDMKLFQYDKKVWEDGDTNRTFQFGIVKNRTLLTVLYETPSRTFYPPGGLNILLSLFTSSSLFGIDFQIANNTVALGFYLFCDYLGGWDK
jgi:hypothetical protein